MAKFKVIAKTETNRDKYKDLIKALAGLAPDKCVLVPVDEFQGGKPPKCLRMVDGKTLRLRRTEVGIELWLGR